MLLKIIYKMKNNIFLKIRLLSEFILVYLISKFLFLIPINLVSYLGGSIFKHIGPYTKTNNIVKKNYSKIFPNYNKSKTEEQIKLCWSNTGKTFFELLVLPKMISSYKISINGLKYLEEIKEKKEQVIFVGIHESNWEILLPSIDKIGVPVGGIYRHINNPYINKLILNLRKKSILSKKSFYTPKGKQSAKEVIESIKKGFSIVLLVDQKDSAGEIVPFFDHPSKTQIGFLKLARKHNLKIIPVHNTRDKNNNFNLHFYPPMDKISNKISDIEFMTKIHEIIEVWIQERPSNWFLQHNRFN